MKKQIAFADLQTLFSVARVPWLIEGYRVRHQEGAPVTDPDAEERLDKWIPRHEAGDFSGQGKLLSLLDGMLQDVAFYGPEEDLVKVAEWLTIHPKTLEMIKGVRAELVAMEAECAEVEENPMAVLMSGDMSALLTVMAKKVKHTEKHAALDLQMKNLFHYPPRHEVAG